MRETVEAYTLGAIGAVEGINRYYVKPYLNEHPGVTAWAILMGGVAAFDALCPKGHTLSETADSAIEKHPLMTRAVIGYTALHLMNLLPEKVDLFHQATTGLKK
jgi:hypothetical protein